MKIISGKEFAHLLESKGGVKKRIKGSHRNSYYSITKNEVLKRGGIEKITDKFVSKEGEIKCRLFLR